jgi:uncharacterized protein
MYLVGGPHPHKIDAQILLERITAERERMVTSAEVLQEILHRYTSLGRKDVITPAFETLLNYVDEVLPIEQADVLRASEIVQHPSGLTARDALHVAVMERHGIRRLLSFDRDFDLWPGMERVYRV